MYCPIFYKTAKYLEPVFTNIKIYQIVVCEYRF